MSKAFTREDESLPVVVAPSARRRGADDSSYITPEGHRALSEELKRLRSVAPANGGAAAAESPEARRAALLEQQLAELTVVPPPAEPTDQVLFGAWVRLEDEEGAEVEYRLVGQEELDVKAGRISVDSPLGRTLLGKRAGDEVTVERPKGRTEYSILSVRY